MWIFLSAIICNYFNQTFSNIMCQSCSYKGRLCVPRWFWWWWWFVFMCVLCQRSHFLKVCGHWSLLTNQWHAFCISRLFWSATQPEKGRTSGQKRCWYSPQNHSHPDAGTFGNLKSLVAFRYFSEAGHQWEAGVWKRRKAKQEWGVLGRKGCHLVVDWLSSIQTQSPLHKITRWTTYFWKAFKFFSMYFFWHIFLLKDSIHTESAYVSSMSLAKWVHQYHQHPQKELTSTPGTMLS